MEKFFTDDIPDDTAMILVNVFYFRGEGDQCSSSLSSGRFQHTQRKSKILQYNTARTNEITPDGEDLEDVKTIIYLGGIIDEHGGPDEDVKVQIVKARAAYLQLQNIRKPKQLSTNNKVRIFNTNVKTVLLYGGRNL
ncbi:unnamed protein product [Schistosoma mattheei]|uniref:DUF6451 domain-containing protein n=1 Tax=Schistosoma mattheei TaxID=31246 RepID=A0A3P8FNH5_9TREM|nr:unnamed protein product [Schistosoma mattheei]